MGQALIEGPDHASVAAFLETLCPADLVNLAPGRQRYTQLLNDDGGIVDDLMVTRPPGADGALRLVVNAARKAVDFALIRERAALGHPPDPARRSGADRPSRPLGGGDLGAPCARGGARDHALHERPAGADSRNSRPSSPARATPAKTDTKFRSPRRRRTASPAFCSLSPMSRRSGSARAIRSSSRPASAFMGTNSTRRSIRSKRLCPGRSKSAGASRADFLARSAFSAALANGPESPARRRSPGRSGACAGRGGDRFARRRADRHRHLRRASARASARRLRWASLRAHTPPVGTPISLVVRGKPLSARVVALPFHPHAYYRG